MRAFVEGFIDRRTSSRMGNTFLQRSEEKDGAPEHLCSILVGDHIYPIVVVPDALLPGHQNPASSAFQCGLETSSLLGILQSFS